MNKNNGPRDLKEFLDEFEKSLPWYIRFIYIPYLRFRILLKKPKR